MIQLSKEVQNGIMPLQRLNNLNLGTNDGGLFSVSSSMGMQNVPTLSISSLGGGIQSIPNVPPKRVPSLTGGSPIMD